MDLNQITRYAFDYNDLSHTSCSDIIHARTITVPVIVIGLVNAIIYTFFDFDCEQLQRDVILNILLFVINKTKPYKYSTDKEIKQEKAANPHF